MMTCTFREAHVEGRFVFYFLPTAFPEPLSFVAASRKAMLDFSISLIRSLVRNFVEILLASSVISYPIDVFFRCGGALSVGGVFMGDRLLISN